MIDDDTIRVIRDYQTTAPTNVTIAALRAALFDLLRISPVPEPDMLERPIYENALRLAVRHGFKPYTGKGAR